MEVWLGEDPAGALRDSHTLAEIIRRAADAVEKLPAPITQQVQGQGLVGGSEGEIVRGRWAIPRTMY